MKLCKECGRRIVGLKDFESELGAAYAQAISDQEFLKFLKNKECDFNGRKI